MPTMLRTTSDVSESFTSPLVQDVSPDMVEVEKTPSKKRRFSFGKLISLVIFLIAIGLFGGMFYSYSIISKSQYVNGDGSSNQDFFSTLGQLGSILNLTKRAELKGEKDGRTNFLLIGKDATGAGLTDTLMIVSYFYKEQKLTTLNIPRDMYYRDASVTGTSGKINALYTWAEQVRKGNGEAYLAEFLGKEFALDIHYWASINFNGVKEVVDSLGGVEINVDKDFVDCMYPTDNYNGYIVPCPSFKQGIEKMDGRRALIYARSRHGTGSEGGDFARGRRQSIVVQAILDKIKSQGVLDNITKITSYLNVINNNFRSSMRLDEIAAMAQILKENPDVKGNYITSVWNTGNGFLCPLASEDGAYIIGYCDGAVMGGRNTSRGREEAKQFLANILINTELSKLFDAETVFIGNESNDTQKAYNQFANLGFNKIRINNSYNQIKKATATSVEKTVIYIKDESIRNLFEKLDPKPNVEYILEKEIPSDVILPKGYENAQIIVWVS